MAQFTLSELQSLDLIGPYGPTSSFSGNSSFTMEGLELIGPHGPFWCITPSSGSAPAFDATKMFLLF